MAWYWMGEDGVGHEYRWVIVIRIHTLTCLLLLSLLSLHYLFISRFRYPSFAHLCLSLLFVSFIIVLFICAWTFVDSNCLSVITFVHEKRERFLEKQTKE